MIGCQFLQINNENIGLAFLLQAPPPHTRPLYWLSDEVFCHLSPLSHTHHLSRDKAKGPDGSVLEENFRFRGDF